MNAVEVLRRLRWFLLVLALLILFGTVLELILVEHTEDAVQWVPFVLCGLGSLSLLTYIIRRTRTTKLLLRLLMAIVFLGSFFGVYQHVSNNVAFEKEIHPNAATRDLVMKGLGGANPLLAPGMLGLAALLAFAATYKAGTNETVELDPGDFN